MLDLCENRCFTLKPRKNEKTNKYALDGWATNLRYNLVKYYVKNYKNLNTAL